MEHLLRFRAGIHSMSSSELGTLDTKHLAPVIDNLFMHFTSKLNSASSWMEVNTIIAKVRQLNCKINDIINARPHSNAAACTGIPNDGQREPGFKQVEDLPAVMISSVASFLQFEDLMAFERCSRRIFLGTRSPISLHGLDQTASRKLIQHVRQTQKPFHFHRFRTLKQFELDVDDVFNIARDNFTYQYAYTLNNIPFWAHLETLTISGCSELDPYLLPF